MSTKSTKTIDDIGIHAYVQYESDRSYFEERIISESKTVANQLSTDVFEPIDDTLFLSKYNLGQKGQPWSLLIAPQFFNQQKGRLFTYQLAPKLGPEETIEVQIERVVGKKEKEEEERKEEENPSPESDQELEEIVKEASKLITLMQDITILNKIMEDINAERYRYKKG